MTRVELYVGDRSAKLRACACISSGARRILTCGEKKHVIELLGTILSVTDCGVFKVQMDVNILTFWLALKANFADMRPQTLKMRQERFLTKGSFFVRSPTNELQGFRERRRRERRKIGDSAGNIAPNLP